LAETWITDASGFKQAVRQDAPWSTFARKLAIRAAIWLPEAEPSTDV
jgi:hypothetical protein